MIARVIDMRVRIAYQVLVYSLLMIVYALLCFPHSFFPFSHPSRLTLYYD